MTAKIIDLGLAKAVNEARFSNARFQDPGTLLEHRSSPVPSNLQE